MKIRKIVIDIFMILILLLILNISFTGVLIHEVIGIIIWVLFFIHLLINYKWIKSISKNIFNSSLKRKAKIFYIVDLLLLINFVIITISGILISQEIFTFLNVSNIYIWTQVHKYSTYSVILLVSTHLIMHYDFFKQQFCKILKSKNKYTSNANLLAILLIAGSIILMMYNLLFVKYKVTVSSKIKETDYSNNASDNDTSSKIVEENSSTDDLIEDSNSNEEITLIDYLGKLVCTGCHRKCPLSHPQCSRGESKAETATEQYYELYN